MKRFDHNDLIAYHLHELSAQKESALERALQTDPSLLAESEAYAATLRAFKTGATPVVDAEVLTRNWMALLPTLPAYRVPTAKPFRWRVPAFVGAGVALAAVSFFMATRHRGVTALLQTSSVRRPSDTAQSSLVAGNSLTTSASLSEEQRSIQERGHTVGLSPRPRFEDLLESSPRKVVALPIVGRLIAGRPIAAQPFSAGPAPVLQLIPFGTVNLPAFPATPPLDIAVEPAVAAQAIAPETASRFRREHNSVHHSYITDLTAAMGGTLIATRTVKGSNSGTGSSSQGATHAVSALVAFHQQFRPAVGYRVAFSYTRPEFQYGYNRSGNSWSSVYIVGRVYEVAATYVIQGPHRGIFSTSVEAGGGVMGIEASPPIQGASYNVRGAAVVGAALDFAITKHLAVHAAYREQAFEGPDFHYSGTAAPLPTTTLFSKEPMVGITYRFSHK